jgi:hypothetical protein
MLTSTPTQARQIAETANALAMAAKDLANLAAEHASLEDEDAQPEPEPAIDVVFRIAKALDPTAEVCFPCAGTAVVRGQRGDLAWVSATRSSVALEALARDKLPEIARREIERLARAIRCERDAGRRAELEAELRSLADAADWDLDAARAA